MKALPVSAIRNNIHQLVDKIDDVNALKIFYEQLIDFKKNKSEGKVWKSLTKDQQEEVLKSYEESENDENLVTVQDFKEKYKKWLPK